MKRVAMELMFILAICEAKCHAQELPGSPADVFEATLKVPENPAASDQITTLELKLVDSQPDKLPEPGESKLAVINPVAQAADLKAVKAPDAAGSARAEAPLVNFADAGASASRGPRIWGGLDYLMWWVRKASVPPLVVTGSPADPFPGALDQPNTQVLFGNHGLDYGMFNGLRPNLGVWLDSENRIGVEASGFVLEQCSVQYSARGDANGQPFLATPFVDALTGFDNTYFISQNFANPAISAHLTGSVGVFSTTDLWSWEVNGTFNAVRTKDWSLDLLGGFRQASLNESLTYGTTVTNLIKGGASIFLLTPIDPPYTVTTFDSFSTRNTFNGGQFGARYERRWGFLSVEVVGKFAMGSMHEVVNIQGQTATNAPVPVTTAVGGIYAQASNIGSYDRDVFAVMPEVGLNLTLQITGNLKARFGYTFLYINNVARPGDQIDQRINVNQVPIDAAYGTAGGPGNPAFSLKNTVFWSQGLNFGLELVF